MDWRGIGQTIGLISSVSISCMCIYILFLIYLETGLSDGGNEGRTSSSFSKRG